jgi:hypothetical protein
VTVLAAPRAAAYNELMTMGAHRLFMPPRPQAGALAFAVHG